MLEVVGPMDDAGHNDEIEPESAVLFGLHRFGEDRWWSTTCCAPSHCRSKKARQRTKITMTSDERQTKMTNLIDDRRKDIGFLFYFSHGA